MCFQADNKGLITLVAAVVRMCLGSSLMSGWRSIRSFGMKFPTLQWLNAQKTSHGEIVATLLCPIPPLAEQSRIVARDREAIHAAGGGRWGAEARAGQPEALPRRRAQGRRRRPLGPHRSRTRPPRRPLLRARQRTAGALRGGDTATPGCVRRHRQECLCHQSRSHGPGAPDSANLPKLPEGWAWAQLDQLTYIHSERNLTKAGFRAWRDANSADQRRAAPTCRL